MAPAEQTYSRDAQGTSLILLAEGFHWAASALSASQCVTLIVTSWVYGAVGVAVSPGHQL